VKRRISAEFAGTSRFEILRCIGAGGMGTVYEAFDKERNARVALKTLRAMNAESLLRFKKEFRDFQDLSHPNLVSVGELFADEGEWFFTMEVIDGVNFLEYVRPGTFVERGQSFSPVPGTPFDEHAPTAESLPQMISSPRGFSPRQSSGALLNEARLRTALRQLALGLHALHEANKVHRDIKPSNVLVTQHGRVVLLDFGLAADLEGREHKSEVDIVGTVEYMAPEQAAARQVGPAADWYAVGVVLYESLTGQVPLSGPPIEVLMNKQRLDAPSPRAINPAAPEDLSRLAAELMRFNPATRPSGKQVLERLGAASPSNPSAQSLSSFSTSSSFVGRAAELKVLGDRFERTRKQAQTVCVHGESGLGKSALVRHFVEQLKQRDPGVVVLAGTCYERESVPFKAVDGLIDALSQYMRRLPKAEAAALLPRRASLLAQVFPVLQRVEAVAEAPRSAEEVLDPQELRSRLFAALRELLERLADRHPLVLVIDDLQWADADSLALLGELMRPPEAPALLLIATVRRDDEASGPVRRQTLTAHLRGEIFHLSLERMSADESRELAATLVKRVPGQSALNAVAIAQEAGGHPLFIDELIRHAVAVGAPTRGALQLEDALWARISQLDPEARRVLEICALASGRLLQQTAAQAAALSFGDFAKQVALLRVAHLMRTTGMRASDSVEPYHDRVRKSVISHLDGGTVRNHHQRLAVALETSGQADPESLAIHWREAGDIGKAAHFAQTAADKAAKALAFDRAAHFYQVCIELLGGATPRDLRVRFADALANAGRGREAGDAYLAAAEVLASSESLDLRRRAAEQLLRAGHFERGQAIFREVLTSVGLAVAPTPNRALFSLLTRRAHLRLRGLHFRQRESRQIPIDTLTRIDTCWSAATGLSTVDTIRGADFQTQHLLLALQSGEPYRISRAISMEAAFASTSGASGAARAARLLREATRLADQIGDPHAIGISKLMAGVVAFQVGDWLQARTALEAADSILRDKCTGVAWETTFAAMFMSTALFYLGDLPALAQRVPTLLQEASARGDLFATTNLRLSNFIGVWLLRDDIAGGRAAADQALSEWSPGGYSAQHYYHLLAHCLIDLYAGDYATAADRCTKGWRELERSLFLRVQYIRCEAFHLRARVALAAGDAARAHHDARKIIGEKAPWATALATLLQAGVSKLRGDLEASVIALNDGARLCEESKMAVYATAARRQLAVLREDAAGISAADDFLRDRRILKPERFTAMLVPGFDVR
jgi:serine/threonine protein kinase